MVKSAGASTRKRNVKSKKETCCGDYCLPGTAGKQSEMILAFALGEFKSANFVQQSPPQQDPNGLAPVVNTMAS